MTTLRSLLCLLLWTSASKAGHDGCRRPGYTNHGTSCFKLYTATPKNWTDAEASCVADGGHLASIHSTEEQEFLANLVATFTDIWIGLSGTPPNMAWSDNTDVDYNDWDGEGPDESVRVCGMMTSIYSYRWLGAYCGNGYNYLCRIEQLKTATSTTTTPSPQQALHQVCFTKILSGVSVDPQVLPSSVQIVSSTIECARRCHLDIQCVHFIMTEKEGKYLCETYTTMMRPQPTGLPTQNYEKSGC